MRGARFNFVAHLGGAPDLNVIKAVVKRIAPLGWHLQIHVGKNEEIADLEEKFMNLPCAIVFDHLGCVRGGRDAVDSRGFQALLRALTTQILTHGAIKTTKQKAKAVRPWVDKMIMLAKDGSDAKRQQVRVGSMGAKNAIGRSQMRRHPDSNRLLPDTQMHRTTDDTLSAPIGKTTLR